RIAAPVGPQDSQMLALSDRERDTVQRNPLLAPYRHVFQFDKGNQVSILIVGSPAVREILFNAETQRTQRKPQRKPNRKPIRLVPCVLCAYLCVLCVSALNLILPIPRTPGVSDKPKSPARPAPAAPVPAPACRWRESSSSGTGRMRALPPTPDSTC